MSERPKPPADMDPGIYLQGFPKYVGADGKLTRKRNPKTVDGHTHWTDRFFQMPTDEKVKSWKEAWERGESIPKPMGWKGDDR